MCTRSCVCMCCVRWNLSFHPVASRSCKQVRQVWFTLRCTAASLFASLSAFLFSSFLLDHHHMIFLTLSFSLLLLLLRLSFLLLLHLMHQLDTKASFSIYPNGAGFYISTQANTVCSLITIIIISCSITFCKSVCNTVCFCVSYFLLSFSRRNWRASVTIAHQLAYSNQKKSPTCLMDQIDSESEIWRNSYLFYSLLFFTPPPPLNMLPMCILIVLSVFKNNSILIFIFLLLLPQVLFYPRSFLMTTARIFWFIFSSSFFVATI